MGPATVLAHAALVHSVYGTDSYERRLLAAGQRAAVAEIAGDRAERLAHLFCVTPRGPLFAGTHRWARELPPRATGGDQDASGEAATRDELDALVLLHMANLAEQARATDGAPGRWLVRLRDIAELLLDGEAIVPPLLVAQLATLSDADESIARNAYGKGVCEEHHEARAGAFALAAACCSVLPEPCVWLAYLSLRRGDDGSAGSWAGHARKRLAALGTAWDKRLTFEQWLEIIDTLKRSAGLDPPLPPERSPVRGLCSRPPLARRWSLVRVPARRRRDTPSRLRPTPPPADGGSSGTSRRSPTPAERDRERCIPILRLDPGTIAPSFRSSATSSPTIPRFATSS